MSLMGAINAGGCGPQRNNCASCTSGGGGAGGAILLEAFEITIAGTLAANGGGGAGAGSGGEDGLLSRTPANGGNDWSSVDGWRALIFVRQGPAA